MKEIFMTAKTIKSYDLTRTRRDLSDVLSSIISESPSFITLFEGLRTATNIKHEWLEDHLKPKKVNYSAYTGNFSDETGTFAVADSFGWDEGDYVKIAGNSAIFAILSKTSNSITVTHVAANGGFTNTHGTVAPPSTAGVLCFVSHPMGEASLGGPEVFRQSQVEWNSTQIVRRDIHLSATSTAVQVYGLENAMVVQEAEALRQISHELNDMALFGVRSLRTVGDLGTAGGLYSFGTAAGGIASALSDNPALTTGIINSAAQKIVEAGGNPTVILCGIGQARVISRLYSAYLNIQQRDEVRGTYVSQIVNEATGGLMRVVVEPKLDDSDIWVIDPTGLGLVWLRGIVSSDATASNMDGVCRKVIGEATFEFKNAKQKLCRISGLGSSILALA